MTKEEALYQAKLIIEQLPEDEYNLLPIDQVNYINENCKYNEKIQIDPNIPLSEQNIDEQTVEILKKLINNTDFFGLKKYEEDEFALKKEIVNLETEIEKINFQHDFKMSEIKKIIQQYKDALEQANLNIDKMKKNNEELYSLINKVPKLFRKIFFKVDVEKFYLNN